MLVDRRQFVISNKYIEIDGFAKLEMDGLFFLYQNDLSLQFANDKSGIKWMIAGDAYCVNLAGKKVIESIAEKETSEVCTDSFFWTGRWALIGNGSVYTDASGLMGIYYYSTDLAWVISSSLHLIYELYKTRFGDIRDKYAMHEASRAFPAPDTCLEGVKKLFPSQYINYSAEGGIKTRYQEKYTLDRNRNFDEKIELLGQYIRNTLINISCFSDKKIKLALTAGFDSRVLLAALLRNNMEFEAFTMQHNYISKADYQIPEKMSAEFGFPYKYITRRGKADVTRLKEYDLHCFFSIKEVDRDFYAYKQTDMFAEDCIVLKGGILDLCRSHHFQAVTSGKELQNLIIKSSPDTGIYQRMNHSLSEWFSWVEKHPNALDIRDRFNIEQHLGGWLANLQQSADLLDAKYLQVANSAAIISLILSFSEEDRKEKKIYSGLYHELYSKVGEYPINPKDRGQLIRYYWNTLTNNPLHSIQKVFKKVR